MWNEQVISWPKGTRADAVLRRAVPGLTRRQIEEAFEKQLVERVGGGVVGKGHRALADGGLDTRKLAGRLEAAAAGNSGLEIAILFETPEFWIIDKPAAVHSVPNSLFDENTVTQWALAQDPAIRDAFGTFQPELTPHRLDYGTSGLMVVCRTVRSFECFRQLFTEKKIKKTYQAWCWGAPSFSEKKVEGLLCRAPGNRKKMVFLTDCDEAPENFYPSLSRVRVLPGSGAELEKVGAFRATIECYTGVTHQVRLHMASLGHPLVGDALYDELYDTRPSTPLVHQLRAVRLELPDGQVFEASELPLA